MNGNVFVFPAKAGIHETLRLFLFLFLFLDTGFLR